MRALARHTLLQFGRSVDDATGNVYGFERWQFRLTILIL